jgi:hypothetical protein
MMTLLIGFVASAVSAVVLHGWLTTAEVAEFERAVAEAARPVRIDLEHLVWADAEGLRALRRQRGRGVPLTKASPYMELLLAGPLGKGEPET